MINQAFNWVLLIENYLSEEFLRAIEGVFTGYRRSFYGLSEEFRRLYDSIFTGCDTREFLHDTQGKMISLSQKVADL